MTRCKCSVHPLGDAVRAGRHDREAGREPAGGLKPCHRDGPSDNFSCQQDRPGVRIGLIIGFYDGFFGPATGTFLILLFTTFLGMDMVSASATAKPVNLFSNIASLATRIAAGNVLFALAIPAMCCSIAGGWLGARLALRRGAGFIRWVMLGVLAVMTVKLAADWLA